VDAFVVGRAMKRWGWFSRPREHPRWPLPVGIRSSLTGYRAIRSECHLFHRSCSSGLAN
jgi:hypothetical protein